MWKQKMGLHLALEGRCFLRRGPWCRCGGRTVFNGWQSQLTGAPGSWRTAGGRCRPSRPTRLRVPSRRLAGQDRAGRGSAGAGQWKEPSFTVCCFITCCVRALSRPPTVVGGLFSSDFIGSVYSKQKFGSSDSSGHYIQLF